MNCCYFVELIWAQTRSPCRVQLHRSYGSSRQDRCIKHHETIKKIYNTLWYTIHNETLTAEDDIFVLLCTIPFWPSGDATSQDSADSTSRHFGGSVGQKMAARLSQTAPLMGLYTWNAPATRPVRMHRMPQDATGTSMPRIKGFGIHSWFAWRPRGQLMTWQTYFWLGH